jgi:ketosteroid isomerase-like protein
MARLKIPDVALMATPDEVEAQFYEAMREGDLTKLMSVWAEDEEVVCIHPGGARLVGHAAVRSSFESLFANGPIAVRPERHKRMQSVGAAMHSVIEVLQPAGARAEASWIVATNVYVKTVLGWRLLVHHASVAPPTEAAERNPASSVLH